MKKTNNIVTFKIRGQGKSAIENYEKMFLDARTLGKSTDKSFYFHAAYYEGLSLILQVVGEHKNYLYLLMANFLRDYFALPEVMLIAEFDKKVKPLIEKCHG